MGDSRFHRLIRVSQDTDSTKEAPQEPIVLAGTTPAVEGNLHRSDSLTEQVATGLMGNDHTYPTTERFVEGGDKERYQDIANSHLSEGPTPGRIPRPYNDRNMGTTGKSLHSQTAPIGLLLSISGNSAGGQGDASYIPHTSILRPAGHAAGSLRTIDDGAQIPGVYLADPTRR